MDTNPPDWLDKRLSDAISTWVEVCVAARCSDTQGVDHIDIIHVTKLVMDSLYSSIDAQVTILENKKAYNAEL